MKVTLTQREQKTLLIGGLLGLVVLWVYGAFIVGPLTREGSSLGRRVREANDRLRGLEAVAANETALREQEELLTRKVSSLRDVLPSEKELPAVIELLSSLASQAQVKIQTISPQRSSGLADLFTTKDGKEKKDKKPAPPLVFDEVHIQIDALAGYHQLGTFLNLIESQHKPMQLANLRISGEPRDPKRHHVKLLLKAFFAVDAGASGVGHGAVAPQAK